jgi:hypothetical protein
VGTGYRLQDTRIQFSSPEPHSSLQERSGIESLGSIEVAEEYKYTTAPILEKVPLTLMPRVEALVRLNSGISLTVNMQVDEIEMVPCFA